MKFLNQQERQPVSQREIFYPHVMPSLTTARFVDDEVLEGFTSFRDAVVWCWENRQSSSCDEKQDQAIFAREHDVYAPHMSRFVKRNSKSPMDLRADLIPDFEAYTGWRGCSQYIAKLGFLTLMEQVIAARKAA